MTAPLVVFRGGGELASAAARLLFLSGFRVACWSGPRRWPCAGWSASRRRSSPARPTWRACRAGASSADRWPRAAPRPTGSCPCWWTPRAEPRRLRPDVLVDGRMAKRNLGTRRPTGAAGDRPGPRLRAPARTSTPWWRRSAGPTLGRVLWDGRGGGRHRPARAGAGRTRRRACCARRASGVFRGAARDRRRWSRRRRRSGTWTASPSRRAHRRPAARPARGRRAPSTAGVKVGDIDPRGRAVDPARISDKARAVAAGSWKRCC